MVSGLRIYLGSVASSVELSRGVVSRGRGYLERAWLMGVQFSKGGVVSGRGQVGSLMLR